MALNIVFQLLLLVKLCVKKPDGAAVPALGFVQSEMDARKHSLRFLTGISSLISDGNTAVHCQPVISAAAHGILFNVR